MKTKTVIEGMKWVESPVSQDIYHDAMIETARVAGDSLKSFDLIGAVGRVALVEFTPLNSIDPIVPIVLTSTSAARRAAREFVTIMYNPYDLMFYRRAKAAAARYLSACQWLEPAELDFLQKQLQLCAADPMRKIMRGQ